MIRFILISFLLFGFLSCNAKKAKEYSISKESNSSETLPQKNNNQNVKEKILDSNNVTFSYYSYKPNPIPNIKLSGFTIDHAYQIGIKKIVSGYDTQANPDSGTDWGDKLLLLDEENNILFQSKGVGDPYLFEPHFYKNEITSKIIIICQLAFEYNFGGEAFILENGQVSYLGNLDVESHEFEKSLTDIIKIKEKSDEIQFTFKSDTLNIKPGSEDILIKNRGAAYIYKNKLLTFTE